MKKALAFLMAAVMLMSMLTACGNKDVADDTKDNNDVSTAEADQAAADKVAALIDAIYVQERTEETDRPVRGRQGRLGRPDRCPEGTGGR